jgi:hypothetical protein
VPKVSVHQKLLNFISCDFYATCLNVHRIDLCIVYLTTLSTAQIIIIISNDRMIVKDVKEGSRDPI